MRAIAGALEQAEFAAEDVDFIVVGTTIGINAVLTRTGSRVVYLTTEGFTDIPRSSGSTASTTTTSAGASRRRSPPARTASGSPSGSTAPATC